MPEVVFSARSVLPATLVMLLHAAGAHAEDTPSKLGDTAWALPGIVRVGVPAAGPRRFAASGSAGYGFTEPQSSSDGAHHRLSGNVAAAVAPLPELEIALRFDGRYDLHPDDGGGSHGAGVGDPRLLVRGGTAVGDFRLGGSLGAWFPGENAPSLTPGATTIDANALAAFAPRASSFVIATSAGFRLDNSKNAAPDLARTRPGDRLALGLSSSNAVLAGLGVSARVAARTDVLAELSGDFLVGSSAPPVSQSPMRISAGARQVLSDAFALELVAEVSPSGRPSLAPADPLVPVEPRFSVVAGFRYRLPFDRAPNQENAPATVPEQPAPTPAAPKPIATTGDITVHVSGQNGAPLQDVVVEVKSGDKTERLAPAGNGDFVAKGLPVGRAHVTVTADGFTPQEQDVEVGGATPSVKVDLAPAPPSGQLRGLVRSFNGRGLSATVRVEPIGVEAKSDAQGNFTLDVPPGDYEVVIRADRFKPQRRKIHIDQNGVTVLNAELFEGH
jgi:hypothetical protein